MIIITKSLKLFTHPLGVVLLLFLILTLNLDVIEVFNLKKSLSIIYSNSSQYFLVLNIAFEI